jgi:beta-lactamase class A
MPWLRSARRRWAAACLVIALGASATAGSTGVLAHEGSPVTVASEVSSTSARAIAQAGTSKQRAARIRAAFDAAMTGLASDNSDVDFAVAVVDHSKERTYERNADATFVTASVVKVEIVAALLLRLRADGAALSSAQSELAEAMIRHSDNDATNRVWSSIGAAAALAEAGVVFGLVSTVAGTSSWGSTRTTAADQVTLLDAIADPAGPLGTDNTVLLELMAAVADDQSWGVSAAARAGDTVQLKNGWVTVDSAGGTWTINSIGRITGPDTDLTIAILSSGHQTLSSGIAFVEAVAASIRAAIDPVK